MSLTKRFLQDVFEEQQTREWEEGRGYYFHDGSVLNSEPWEEPPSESNHCDDSGRETYNMGGIVSYP